MLVEPRKEDGAKREGTSGIRRAMFQRPGNLEKVFPAVRGSLKALSFDSTMLCSPRRSSIQNSKNQTDKTGTIQKNFLIHNGLAKSNQNPIVALKQSS